ncbi:MAG: cytochrome c oxidase subunit II [Micromonosporaceae bacterium]|nr:cytochrome c oxidase subunit II [Micromonosporaceae bacterium]
MVACPSARRSAAATRRRLAAALVGFGSLILLAGCSSKDAFAFGWPKGVTPQAEQMYDLWIGSVVAALAVGVFVWALIFWCVVRYRKKGEELPPQTRYNMPIEVLYTVIPFLIIAVLFYYTAIIQTYVEKRSERPDVTVEVVAFKWNWQFRYTGTEDQSGEVITETGHSDYVPVLVIPTDRTIRFVEESKDVIHSFWVPELLFKRDVMPGYTNEFEVTVKQKGEYVGRCAELCGAFHSMMNFEVRAVSPADYDTFLNLRSAGRSTPEALEGIGYSGDARYAITTRPYDTKRDATARDAEVSRE